MVVCADAMDADAFQIACDDVSLSLITSVVLLREADVNSVPLLAEASRFFFFFLFS